MQSSRVPDSFAGLTVMDETFDVMLPADPRRARRIQRTLYGKSATDPRKWRPLDPRHRQRMVDIANELWAEVDG